MPSDNCDAVNFCLIHAFDRLPDDDQNRLQDIGSNMIDNLNKKSKVRGVGIAGKIELLGKLGMWMVKNDK